MRKRLGATRCRSMVAAGFHGLEIMVHNNHHTRPDRPIRHGRAAMSATLITMNMGPLVDGMDLISLNFDLLNLNNFSIDKLTQL